MSLSPDRGKFGYGIILFPDRIVILTFGFMERRKPELTALAKTSF